MRMPEHALEKLKSVYADTINPANPTQANALAAVKENLRQVANGDDNRMSVSLKYFCPNVNCFSDLNENELKKFSLFCTTITTLNDESDLMDSEFACTTEKNYDDISKVFAFRLGVNSLSHYKLSNGVRIHGAWKGRRFKLVIIDTEHEMHV